MSADFQEIGPKSYGDILRLGAPLILTTSGVMVMQFIDALFLSWYSADAVAAAIPAGMASWLIISTFVGAAGYTSTFVAQFVGAKRPDMAASTVWQGIYFGIVTGIFAFCISFIAKPLFAWVGHPVEIRDMEAIFFMISCWGAGFSIVGNALSGFYSGRDDTRTIMIVQVIGLLVNGILDYVLIFGKFGFPRLGITGAAIATVTAQAVICFVFLALFLDKNNRREFGTWRSRKWEINLFKRLVQFGFPTGIRFTVEVLAWTMFLFFVGRIGTRDLVETNIAWRINGIAFFPIIGLSQAVAIYVGNAQGAKRPDISADVTYKGLLIGEIWMLVSAAVFVLFPHQLYGLFYNPQAMTPEYFAQVQNTGVILLRLVALYCLLDAFNIIIMGTLQAAGDTRWTLGASLVMHLLFLAALWIADFTNAGLYVEWAIATAFVMSVAMVWLARFRSGRWKSIEVVEKIE